MCCLKSNSSLSIGKYLVSGRWRSSLLRPHPKELFNEFEDTFLDRLGASTKCGEAVNGKYK